MLLGRKPIGTIAYMGGLMAVPEAFAWCWGQMVAYNSEFLVEPSESVHYERATISFHAAARNNLVDRMRGDWLLMLDTDIVFDPDLAARMTRVFLKEPDVDVLAALYQYKSPPHNPVLYKWAEDGEHFEMLGDWEKPAERMLLQVASAGAGGLLVRRRVFQRIKEELGESPFDITPPYGEDHSFFLRLKRVGIAAYCDPAIQVSHLMLKPLTFEDYDRTLFPIAYPKEVNANGNS